MTKAKLALAVVALSSFLISPTARAADEIATDPVESGTQVTQAGSETEVNADTPSADHFASITHGALGDMMALGAILAGDMPPPASRTTKSSKSQKYEDQVAIGGAPNAALLSDGAASGGSVAIAHGGPAMCPPGAKGGFPKHGKNWCPLTKLEGANALTDDQYQKLYDIKTQFITTIVPKGLSMYSQIQKMKDLLTAGDTDMKAIRDLQRQIASGTSDLSMCVMDSLITVDQVLTPAQRVELHKKMVRSEMGGGHRKPDAK